MKKVPILCALMLCGAQAANAAVYAGTCGANAAACSWSLNTDNGTLTITGNGAMKDYVLPPAPWLSYRSSIKSVSISGVTSIGMQAFQNCTALTQVTIPSSVTSIITAAFLSCKKLTMIIALNPTPVSINSSVFEGVPRTIPLYVPSGSEPAYRAKDVWKEFQMTPLPSVTFNSQGGTAVAPQTLAPNTKAVQPADPAKNGYTFCGWYRETSCVNEWNFNTAVTGNITLFAKWQANQITITYKCEGVGCNPNFHPQSVPVQRNP